MKRINIFLLFIFCFALVPAKGQQLSKLLYYPNDTVKFNAIVNWDGTENCCPYVYSYNINTSSDTVEVHLYYHTTGCPTFFCTSNDTVNLGQISKKLYRVVRVLNYQYYPVTPDTTYLPHGDRYYMLPWPTNVGVISNNENFVISPNPATESLSLINKSDETIPAQLLIVDVTGKTVQQVQKKINNGSNSIDISNLKSGIYFITLRSNLQLLYQGRFLKE